MDCKHDMLEGTCSLCKSKPPRKAGVAVVALYDGYCPNCEKPIYGGTDEIMHDGVGWVHLECN